MNQSGQAPPAGQRGKPGAIEAKVPSSTQPAAPAASPASTG